jgi:hypothetical protein
VDLLASLLLGGIGVIGETTLEDHLGSPRRRGETGSDSDGAASEHLAFLAKQDSDARV